LVGVNPVLRQFWLAHFARVTCPAFRDSSEVESEKRRNGAGLFLVLGDVGARPGVSCWYAHEIDQAAESPQTLNISYVGATGE